MNSGKVRHAVYRLAAGEDTRIVATVSDTEPAGFSSMRGVAARIYNAIVNDAEHLFYYEGNLTGNDQAIGAWLKYAPMLDQRGRPRAGIAVVFPDTANKMKDDTLRYLRASAYLQRVHTMRAVAVFDMVSEQMIMDGALERYKAVIIVWGNTMEKAALDRIGEWVKRGGVVFYPDRELTREGLLQTVEGDSSIYRGWQAGETGKGHAGLFAGQTEPFSAFAGYVRRELPKVESLSSAVRAAVTMRKPDDRFWTEMEDGRAVLLNYGDAPAVVGLSSGEMVTLARYSIRIADEVKGVKSGL